MPNIAGEQSRFILLFFLSKLFDCNARQRKELCAIQRTIVKSGLHLKTALMQTRLSVAKEDRQSKYLVM
jgi:hypothetical protein